MLSLFPQKKSANKIRTKTYAKTKKRMKKILAKQIQVNKKTKENLNEETHAKHSQFVKLFQSYVGQKKKSDVSYVTKKNYLYEYPLLQISLVSLHYL